MRVFLFSIFLSGLNCASWAGAQSPQHSQNQSTVTAADESGESADMLLRRGLALAHADHLDDAEQIFLEGKQRFPADKRFLQELAGLEYRKNNSAAAKSYLREALRHDALDSYGNDFLGSLYMLEGNLPAALKYWNRIDKPLLNSVQFSPLPSLTPVLRERTFAISAGQVFTLQRLLRTEARLNLLSVFTDFRFELTPRPDQRFDLTIRTTPIARPLRGWLGQVLPVLRSLPYQGVNLDFYNLRRRAINFTSLWRWDREKRRIAVEFSGLVHMWRYRLLLDSREENWDLTTTYDGPQGDLDNLLLRKLESGADFERDLTEKLRWTIGARIANRQYRNGDGSPFFSNGWSTEIRNRFDYLLLSWPDQRLRMDAWTTLRTGRIFTGFPSRLVSADVGLKGRWRLSGIK
jgi:tetratricopeptide (TPR) repeat protein